MSTRNLPSLFANAAGNRLEAVLDEATADGLEGMDTSAAPRIEANAKWQEPREKNVGNEEQPTFSAYNNHARCHSI